MLSKFRYKIFDSIALKRKKWELRKIGKTKNFNPETPFLIFSDPRGGSTWLAEIINCIPKTFIYWEPLAINKIKELKKLNFGWRQHVPQNSIWPEAKRFFNKVLSVKIINDWTMMKVNINDFEKGELPIIKICRGNDLLLWLIRQYNFNYKPVYLIRHPFAVVASQLKQGGWNHNYSSFPIPDMRYNDKYVEHKEFLCSCKSIEEILLASWCLSNMELLKSKSSGFLKIYYEHLIKDPEKCLARIFNIWDLPMPQSIHDKLNVKSFTNVDYLENDSIDDQLNKWRNVFSQNTIYRLQQILDYFDIDSYSKDSTLPLKNQ